MNAHSDAVCQCSSRTPPAVRRISTPASDFETASSRWVTSRDQPPSCIRLCANEKGYLKVCTPPASVGGGLCESGLAASSAGLAGRGSLALRSGFCFAADCSCAANFSPASMPAAARAAEPTPRKPLRVRTSFSVSSLTLAAFRNGNGYRQWRGRWGLPLDGKMEPAAGNPRSNIAQTRCPTTKRLASFAPPRWGFYTRKPSPGREAGAFEEEENDVFLSRLTLARK